MIRTSTRLSLLAACVAVGAAAFLPLGSASSADPVASASATATRAEAPPNAAPPPCEEVCATALRALGECDLDLACSATSGTPLAQAIRAAGECDVSEGRLQGAVSLQARRQQLDCKGFCATIPPDEVRRIDACFPRWQCSDFKECLAAVGASNHPAGVSVRERDAAEMVTIPAGPFVRGVPAAARTLRDVDRSTVDVGAFRIDRFEVTVDQYSRCYSDRACPPPSIDGELDPATVRTNFEDWNQDGVFRSVPEPRKLEGCNWGVAGRAKHPVNCVDYRSARAYCEWAGARLPSELEWEKAARGTDGRRFPWGVWDRSCARLTWDPDNSYATRGCSAISTSEVGAKPGGNSPFGVSDLGGNVWEWVGGLYHPSEYADPKTDFDLTPAQVYGVIRGGGWGRDDGNAYSHDASTRFRWFKQHRIEGVGFRCAMGGA